MIFNFKLVSSVLMLLIIGNATMAFSADKEVIIVFSGDTLGYVEPCG